MKRWWNKIVCYIKEHDMVPGSKIITATKTNETMKVWDNTLTCARCGCKMIVLT